MASIDFFTPVVYPTPARTWSQWVLQTVDESFYLGGRFRVGISSPTNDPSFLVAQKNYFDRRRSWTNITLKIGYYCTVIPPLAALAIKAFLRWYLNISTIAPPKEACQGSPQKKRQSIILLEESWQSSLLEREIPKEILQKIALLLNYQDQQHLACVAHFTHGAVRFAQEPYFCPMRPIRAEIEAFNVGCINLQKATSLFIQLITVPAEEGPPPLMEHLWDPLMRHMLRYFLFQSGASINFATFKEVIVQCKSFTSHQADRFCRCLALKLSTSNNYYPWYCYRLFEFLWQQFPNSQTEIKENAQKYLMLEAERKIKATPKEIRLKTGVVNLEDIDIDPRQWFGTDGHPQSLWAPEGSRLPELVQDAIWGRIQVLCKVCPGQLMVVDISSRREFHPPEAFLLPLAQKITDAQIFLSGYCITPQKLNQPKLVWWEFNALDGQKQEEIIQLHLLAMHKLVNDTTLIEDRTG